MDFDLTSDLLALCVSIGHSDLRVCFLTSKMEVIILLPRVIVKSQRHDINAPGKNYVCEVALKTLFYLSICVSQAVPRRTREAVFLLGLMCPT